MNNRPIRISPATRTKCVQAVQDAPDGWLFTPPAEPTRGISQNAKLHALFADIARQHEFFGQKRDMETVKRLLVDAFARVKAAMGEPLPKHGHMLPSLDGRGAVQLGIQTRNLSARLMSELIEYVHAWGAENNVRFTDNTAQVPDWYQDKEPA